MVKISKSEIRLLMFSPHKFEISANVTPLKILEIAAKEVTQSPTISEQKFRRVFRFAHFRFFSSLFSVLKRSAKIPRERFRRAVFQMLRSSSAAVFLILVNSRVARPLFAPFAFVSLSVLFHFAQLRVARSVLKPSRFPAMLKLDRFESLPKTSSFHFAPPPFSFLGTSVCAERIRLPHRKVAALSYAIYVCALTTTGARFHYVSAFQRCFGNQPVRTKFAVRIAGIIDGPEFLRPFPVCF